MTHRSRVFPFFAAALALTSPTTAVEAQTVHVALIVPADRGPRADYLTGVDIASRDLQAWFQMQLGDTRTFVLDPAGVKVLHSTHNADWFRTNPNGAAPSLRFFRNAVEDAEALLGHRIGAGHTPDVWALYVDADPACGQCGGCGGSGLLVIAKNDLRGLVGEPYVPICPNDFDNAPNLCRWVGGLGHELGHAFGLPHPPGCDAGSSSCDYHALMWNGFRSYGNSYLRPEERLFLQASPFMQPQGPLDVVTACHAGTPTPPNTPTEVAAHVVGSTVTLTWSTSMRATSYVVEAGSGPGLANLYNSDVGNTTAINTAAPSGTYHVRVRAKNDSGLSAPSSEVSFSIGTPPPLPPPPTGLAVQVSSMMVSLTWSASSGATSYVIEAGSAPGLANFYNADVGNTTAITTAAPDGNYHVRVRAKNGAGVSGASTEVSFSIDSTKPPCNGPPGRPASLTFAQAGNSIDLRWTPAPGSLSFVVEAGSATGLSDLFNGQVGAQPELAASAPAGIYFVRVRGVNACGTGHASNEVVVKVP